MLRILTEFGKVLTASKKMGEDKSLGQLLDNPMILLEVRSLLWVATEMAKRIGNLSEVEAYLNSHAEEDEKSILEGMKDAGRAMLEDILSQGGIPKCASCGNIKCPICRECHKCGGDSKRDHEVMHSPFGGAPSKGEPN